MSSKSPLRLVLALLTGIALLFLLLLGILLTDTLVNIWHNLREAPAWLQLVVVTLLLLFSLFSGWLVWRVMRPKQPLRQVDELEPVDRETLDRHLDTAREKGLDTSSAEQELQKLERRREAGSIHVALFGEISSGKSSLIKALLPDAQTEINVTGGTTQDVHEYRWRSPAGDELVLTDMPGLDETGGHLDSLSRQEALRAHVVIYIVDGDLTRSQAEKLQALLKLEKPTLVALNKIDRYSDADLERVRQQLQEKVDRLGKADVIPISTGGRRQVTRILPDGREEQIERELPPKVDALQQALQRIIDSHSDTLDSLRDSAVFVLVKQKLNQQLQIHRREEAEKLVSGYARKAVAGAIAAMTPGTDILIQGFLATQMIKDLSRLYDIPVRKVDLDLLLELIQKRVSKQTTLLLAVAGNALKAFPGVGTVAGGLLHAVVYGFLFDALGKSIAASLDSRGELHPLQVANQFEDQLGEDIKTSAVRYARMAFQEVRSASKDD
ncbi:GTPase [Thiolapillus sp.]|uniref:GTPase n=1 Tax=Thiolapillus sp. TaxID=2017437 RepID=UPI003AF4F8D2